MRVNLGQLLIRNWPIKLAAMFFAINGTCGAIFGACAMIVASTLTTTHPASCSFRAAERSSARLSALR